MRTPSFAFAGVPAGVLLAGGARAQDDFVEESSSVNRLEDDVVEYRNDRVQIIATHYYFQGPHDPRWLLIDVGIKVMSGVPLTVARRDISIVRPDGVDLPLASQREYRRSRAELLPMLLAPWSIPSRTGRACEATCSSSRQRALGAAARTRSSSGVTRTHACQSRSTDSRQPAAAEFRYDGRRCRAWVGR